VTRGEIRAADGAFLATLHWDGRGRPLYLVHATGFCGAMWDPVARALASAVAPRAIDVRGHGRSDKPDRDYPWSLFADDLAAWIASEGAEGVFAMGHSSGATAIALAAAREPARFARILLLDPVLLPPPAERDEAERAGGFGLADRARKRRGEFPSLAALREQLRGKPPYSLFTDEIFELYLAHAVEVLPDGRARLLCPPEIESRIYTGTTAVDPWQELRHIRARTRVAIPKATGMRPHLQERLAGEVPGIDVERVPGTHFLPLENPDLVVRLAREWFAAP
jgi:pimeloyl-ACP methyl ester carboxylesterase